MPGPGPHSVSLPRSIPWDNEMINILSSLFEEVLQLLRLFRFEVFFNIKKHSSFVVD